MSDLAATNCGCGNNGGCGSILWLIILMSLCNGNNGSGLFGNDGCGCDGNNGCMWIILLLLCCGGCGNNFC